MGLGLAMLGGSLISGILGKSSTDKASSAASAASAASIAEQKRQFDINQANQAPFLEAGTNALSQLEAGIGQSPSNIPQFGAQQALPQFGNQDQFNFNLEADPGYNFAKNEATNAVNAAQASQGGFNSGNRLAALGDRIAGISSQFANDAFNRQKSQSDTNFGRDVQRFGFDRDRNQQQYGRNLTQFGLDSDREGQLYGRDQTRLNRLSSLAGVGQTSANQQGTMGANLASNIGNTLTQTAATQGQLGMQGANAINSAVQGGMSNYILNNALNKPMGYTDPYGYGVG